MQDREILIGLKNGDKAYLKYAFDKYHDAMKIHADHYTKDIELAKDIVQEIFISLWNRRDKIKSEVALGSYLFTSIRNNYFKLVKHQKAVKSHQVYEWLNSHVLDQRPEYKEELIDMVPYFLSNLRPRYKQVLTMVYFNRMSHIQIGASLEISPNTVRNLLVSAKEQLRALINSHH